MKIATWNIERLKSKEKLSEILSACKQVNADIFILTETDQRVSLDYPYSAYTASLENSAVSYRCTERCVGLFSRYPIINTHTTYDDATALCVELETDVGNLLVYGTIMGIYGNRHPNFREDVSKQLEDLNRLSHLGLPLCVCGDFNCSFSDNYYFTSWGRTAITKNFLQHQLMLLTMDSPECIDHIALSQSFVGNIHNTIEVWNEDKHLSDHKGISVCFTQKEI